MTKTLIRNGTVVNSTGSGAADVLIDGDTIAAVLVPGSTLLGFDIAANVDTVIDAKGKLVIPGGIDAHTHFELPFGGTEASDTFESGTRAAAWGGTTSVIDFAVQTTGTKIQDGLAKWHAKAAGNCAIDYGFHQIMGGVDEDSLKAMNGFVDEGITSYKMFMAYPGVFYSDDGQILQAMQKAADIGLLTMMHAENGPAIDVLAAQLVAEGKNTPYYHGIARAWQMEEEATHRAIMLGNLTGAPLYIVHVSAKQAVDQLAWARKEVLELLERHTVDAAAVRVAEAGGRSVSLGRSEVEGVVQEALASAGLSPARHVAVTIRGAYGARNNAELEPALSAIPVIRGTGMSRRDPVVSAVALLPE